MANDSTFNTCYSDLVISEVLITSGAVKLEDHDAFTYASGKKGPLYVDCRVLLSLPDARKKVVWTLCDLIEDRLSSASPQVIAGVATSGVPWATLLSQQFHLPLVYVRPEPKQHGTARQIEGILQQAQSVLVVEDVVNSGVSARTAAGAIHAHGGNPIGCLALLTYNNPIVRRSFFEENLPLYPATTIDAIIALAREKSLFSQKACTYAVRWLSRNRGAAP